MQFKIFQKNLEAVWVWRKKNGFDESIWPDSRDPEFSPIMIELGVVAQDLEKSLVALCAWREGHQDVYQGMSAVVHLLRNRQNEGDFRSHLTDQNQFPSMTDQGNPMFGKYPNDPPGQEFELLLENLDDILQGKTVDLSQASIYYADFEKPLPEWFSELVKDPKVVRTTKIGNRVFYKRIK